MSTELDLVNRAVADFDAVAAGLDALKQKYTGVVYDVATTKGMTEAKEARAAIREPRYAIENTRKAAKAPILNLGRKLDSRAAEITAEILKIEEPIQAQIAAEESRKEAERQAKIAAELKRVSDIQERIAELRGGVSRASNEPAALILEYIVDLEKIPVDDSFAEFRQQAEDAKAGGLAALREMHGKRVEHEAEQARLKAEREELTRLRQEEAARQAQERARLAEEERQARAKREAEEAQARAQRQAEEEQAARWRKIERERLDAQAAELARQQFQARLAAAEAADKARQPAPLPTAETSSVVPVSAEPRAPAPVQRLPRAPQRPSADEIVKVLAEHFGVEMPVVVGWLVELEF